MDDPKKYKILFDLVNDIGESDLPSMHIIDIFSSGMVDEYRIYHSDGYCISIKREEIDLAEDESCDSCIDGYEYTFNDDIFEGFKEININDAIQLIKKAKPE